MPMDARPTLASPDDDPYLWLEEVDGAAALSWAEAQSKATLARFGGAAFAADRDTLAAILDRPDKIPYVTRRGAHLYNFWTDAEHRRGLWRRTTLESFRTDAPSWDVVLDVDALAAQDGEDWVWRGPSTLPGSHDRVILSLSRGGSDAVVLREFDIPAKSFVKDGFFLPEAKSWAEWLDKDALLLSSPLGRDKATKSGYARTVRLWRRGADAEAAPVLFEVAPDSMLVAADVDHTLDEETVWFFERPAFFDLVVWMGDRTGPKVRLDLPSDIAFDTHGDWLAVKRRSAWTIGEATYAPDTVLGTSLSAFLAGERRFEVLFEPGERRALQHFFWCKGRLVLSILDELQPVFEVLTPSAQGWGRSVLPGLPAVGVVNVWRLDMEESESNGDLLADAQDPVTPSTMMFIARDQFPERPQARPKDVHLGWPPRHAPRGALGRRRAHPLRAGRPRQGNRRRARAHDRLRRLQGVEPSLLPVVRRQAVARAGRDQRHRQHPRGRRVRHALARRRPPRGQAPLAR